MKPIGYQSLYYSGTSGLILPVTRKFYPPEFEGKSRLAYYSSLFNSVEINSSFYKTPKIQTILNWADSVPERFRFTFKLSKAISHMNKLAFDVELVKSFMDTIDHVGCKKGSILVQFPPALQIERLKQVEKLLEHIRDYNTGNDWKIALEFRHSSWYQPDVYQLLSSFDAAIVFHDLPASVPPPSLPSGQLRYIRFHGPVPGYRGSYSDDFLKQFAGKVKAWLQEGCQVYCYFNNTMGDALNNLQTLNNLVN